MILVSGSLAFDRIMDYPGYFRDHIDPKKLHVLSVCFMVKTFKENFGGTAGNIAYNLALLGEKPTILSSAGNDFASYGQWLRAKGIGLDYVRQVKDVPTASAYIMTDQADCQITAFYPGAMGKKYKVSSIKYQVLKQVKLAIVAPGNIEDMRVLPRFYKKYKVPYIFDPGQAIPALSGAELKQGIDGAKVFISNDYELGLVLTKTGLTKKQLLGRIEVLVTTLGERGSVIEGKISNIQYPISKKFILQNSYFRIPVPPAKPKNTCDPTGAGDAYRAGLIKGLLMGLPYDKIGKLASVVSVYTVEKYGTQTHHFIWDEIKRRYKVNFKENLI